MRPEGSADENSRIASFGGYVVAAVDHPGNYAIDPQTVQGMTLWWPRAHTDG